MSPKLNFAGNTMMNLQEEFEVDGEEKTYLSST